MSSAKLRELDKKCELLASSRASSQAEGLDGIKVLLEDKEVVDSLNDERKPASWNHVFQTAIEYLQKECQTMQQKYKTWTDSGRKNKVKKLLDSFSLAKRIIRIANSDRTRLKLHGFLDFLLKLLEEEVFVLHCGTCILLLISDNIVNNRKYGFELSQEQIGEMFTTCERELMLSEEKNKFVASVLFLSVTRVLIRQTNPDERLHDIFLNCAKGLENVKSHGVIENILAAINSYVKWCSVTHLTLCCQLGEDCLDVILKVWKENAPSDKSNVLELLLEFCSTQVSLHHPNLTVDSSLGCYAKTCSTWHRQLYSILLIAELQLMKQYSGLFYKSREEKAVKYNQSCVRLIGDICCVMFQLCPEGKLEYTLNDSTGTLASRINFCDILSLLSFFTVGKDKKISENVKPWLSILCYLVQNHEEILKYSTLMSMAEKFRSLLLNASIDSIGENGIDCLSAIFKQLSFRFSSDTMVSAKDSEIFRIWHDCWNVGSSCLTQTVRLGIQNSALSLLTILIEFDVACQMDFFVSTKQSHAIWSSLYLHIPPCTPSLRLGLSYVQSYGIKCSQADNTVFKTLLQSTARIEGFSNCGSYEELRTIEPLKLLLLHWLLGYKEEALPDKQTRQIVASQVDYKHDLPKRMIALNILSGKLNSGVLNPEDIKMISSILFMICQKKILKNSAICQMGQELSSTGISISQYLDPEYVVTLKYFDHVATCYGNVKPSSHSKIDACLKRPVADASLEVTFHILRFDMNLVSSRISHAIGEKTATNVVKLFKIIFGLTNVSGKFIQAILSNDKLHNIALTFFEEWLQTIANVSVNFQSSLQKWPCLLSDEEFMNALFCDSETLVTVFYGLQAAIRSEDFQPAKSIFESSLIHVCNTALNVYKLACEDVSNHANVSNEVLLAICPDDTQRHTQNVPHSLPGYKRRRYGGGDAPPVKQKRYSSRAHLDIAQSIMDGGDSFDSVNIFTVKPLIMNAMSLICVVCKNGETSSLIKRILEIVSNLDPVILPELALIFNILDQISSVCDTLAVDDMLEIMKTFQDVFIHWYKDQFISTKFQLVLAKMTSVFFSGRELNLDHEVMKRVSEFVQSFWKCKTKGKSSYGILSCLSMIVQTQNILACGEGGEEEPFDDIFTSLLSFTNNPHDGIRFFAVSLLKSIFSSKRNDVQFESLQKKALAFIAQSTKKFFGQHDDICLTDSMSFVSVSLHAICAIMPYTSSHIEQDAHFQICTLASLHQKFSGDRSNGAMNLMLRFVKYLATEASSDATVPANFRDKFNTQFMRRHLQSSLHRWTEPGGNKLLYKIQSFPFELFEYDCIYDLCVNHQKECLAVVFYRCKSLTDLEEVIRQCFFPKDSRSLGKSLMKSFVLDNASDIIAFGLPATSFPDSLSKIVNAILQRKNSLIEMGHQHFARILVDVLVKTVARDASHRTHIGGLDAVLTCLTKFCQPTLRITKQEQKNVCGTIGTTLVSRSQDCSLLVEAFSCMRKHISKVLYPQELTAVMKAFSHLVSLVFKADNIPDHSAPYLLKSIIYIVAYHVISLDQKLQSTLCKTNEEALLQSGVTCLDVLVEVFTFLKHCTSAVVGRAFRSWVLAVPIVSSLALLQQLADRVRCAKSCGISSVYDTLLEKLDAIKNLASSQNRSGLLQNLLIFSDESCTAEVDLTFCVEVFENSFSVLEDHELICGHATLLNNICGCLKTIFEKSGMMHSLPIEKLNGVVGLLLKAMHYYWTSIPNIFDCVTQAYCLIPGNMPEMEKLTEKRNKEGVLFDVLNILSHLVTSNRSEVSEDASTCICRLLQLPVVIPCWKKLAAKNQVLVDLLNVFNFESGDNGASLPPNRIESLHSSFRTNEDIFSVKYEEWICHLTSRLVGFCNDATLRLLKPVCASISKLSALLLPFAIHDIMVGDPTLKAREIFSSYIQNSFETFLNPQKHVQLPVKSMQSLLDVMQFLRSQSISDIASNLRRRGTSAPSDDVKSTSWDNNFWLDIDYSVAAGVAVACHQPFTAILYTEIWKDSQTKEGVDGNAICQKSSTCRSLLGALNGSKEMEDATIGDYRGHGSSGTEFPNLSDASSEKILIQAYSQIDNVDCLHGLRKSCTEDLKLMMHIHEKESNWEEALHCYCYRTEYTPCDAHHAAKISANLKYCGLGHIGELYQYGYQQTVQQNQPSDNLYAAATRMSKWDDIATTQYPMSCSSYCARFDSQVTDCLVRLNDEDISLISLTDSMRTNIAKFMSGALSEMSVSNVDVVIGITQLVVLKEILEAENLIRNNDALAVPQVLDKWNQLFTQGHPALLRSYDSCDAIASNRHNIISILSAKFSDNNLQMLLAKSREGNLCAQIEHASDRGRKKLALKFLSTLKQQVSATSGISGILEFENYTASIKKAELLWDLGRKTEALSEAEKVQDSLQISVCGGTKSKYGFEYLLSKILQVQGQWINDTKVKGPSVIMEEYFKKSVATVPALQSKKFTEVTMVTDIQVQELCVSGYKSMARFADAQYQEIINYMKSSEFEHKRALVREAEGERKQVQSKSNIAQNPKYTILLQKNYEMDEKDLNDILQRKETFLLCAFENYIRCLMLTDEDDVLMYRVCSLWFSNIQSASLPSLMNSARKELKTHKFVEMSYQMAARLDASSKNRRFQSTLKSLLFQVAVEHPHHVLPVLFALANACKDERQPKQNVKKTTAQIQDHTSLAAQSIINQVRSRRPQLVMIMGELFDAYIQFANWDVSKFSKITTAISLEKSLLINKFCNAQMTDKFSIMAVPTVEMPVDKLGVYDRKSTFVSLRNVKSYFKLCGGVNLPKIIVAVGSDGSERKHLVKGRDDLRQDAVMQQVFSVVNTLLNREEGPSNLKLRTYKVVPLSQRSGLVEWCEGTVPIGHYLVGVAALRDYGAHHRYRPKDILSYECRKKLSAASGKGLHQKLATYRDICAKFKPVFRHFFYENFTEPSNWFWRRTAYCKSVAVSSLVGYVLGLGDRHVQNILIDCSSGEVIHIDLGVAFEQGRCLPTPEMVPFRLTRDIVDAFGSAGVEGLFRRNCERTLTVLRKFIDTISTILEVLLHDPLHDWMMTKSKAFQIQRQQTGANTESEMTSSVLNASSVAELLQNDTVTLPVPSGGSSLAGRALLRAQEKLRGLESGSVLSVEGQINLLIQQATDEERLCAMFAGWQPYI